MDSQSSLRYNNKKLGALQDLVCPTCECTFRQKRRKQTHCLQSNQCRPWLIQFKENGSQSPRYRIGALTTAEYAFYRIMQDCGVELDYLSQGVSGLFALHRGCYTPDFYNAVTHIYYEVSGSRQALEANKHKYYEMRQKYPDVMLKIVAPDGTEIDFAR